MAMRSAKILAAAVTLLAAVLALPSVAAAAPPRLEVGVGRADITPPTGYYMMGWVRSDAVVSGVNTRLWARVIVLKEGARKIALVAEDLNGIPGGMLEQAAELDRDIGFSDSNVLDSASHTHAAPTSFYNFSTYDSVFMTLHSPTDFDLTGKVDPQLYTFMVTRLALAIRRANANLGPGAIGWGQGQVDDVTQNRSLEAHLYDFGIHLAPGQGKPSMDPRGPLDTIDPAVNVMRVDKLIGGRRVPVGMWSTFANHGTVDKFQFTYYNQDHFAAATQTVEETLRRAARVPGVQDVVDVYGNSDEGDMSSGLVRSGPAAAQWVGDAEARAFLGAWRRAGRHMQRSPQLDWRWTRMCWCGQQTPDGPVADKAAFGLSEFTGSEEGRGPLYDITRVSFEGDHLPIDPGTNLPVPVGQDVPISGPQGDKILAPIPLTVPTGVPLMTVRVGDRLLGSIPGEMTVEMGRRVRAAVLHAAAGHGIAAAVISGLANEYADYFTTPQEYDAQHYEGAATIYGRASADALEQTLVSLTGALVSGRPAPTPYASDPTQGLSPNAAPFPTGAAHGTVAAQPPASAARLGHPSFSWRGAARGYDRPLDSAFVLVQRRVAGPHHCARWRTVDSDLGVDFLWTVDSNGLYRAEWEVPLGEPLGRYRFVVEANHYTLVSAPFRVAPSRALTLARLASAAGTLALALDYPRPNVHEAVGDPPGDSTADLTYRPPSASSGAATALVGGRRLRVPIRGGVLRVAAPPGAQIEVPAGAARDGYGNRNGSAASFTP